MCVGTRWCRNVSIGAFMMIGFHTTMLVLTSGQLSAVFLYLAISIAFPFVEAANVGGRLRALSPIAWWSVALFVRVLPRLLSYAQRVQ